jgi:HEPN domain-containing protein
MANDPGFGVSEQTKASIHRLDDAKVLLANGRWRGAMYLAGYSVECLLKAKLMRNHGCRNLDELDNELRDRGVLPAGGSSITHDLSLLLLMTRAGDRLRENLTLWRQFNRVNKWIPAWRYTADLSNREDAQFYLDAVQEVRRWIEANV